MKSVFVTIFAIVLFFIGSAVSADLISIKFSDLTINKVKIKFQNEANNDKLEIKGGFKLGQGSNGITPLLDGVVIILGTSTIIIPANSFVEKMDKITFQGIINSVNVEMEIQEVYMGRFEFKIKAKHIQLNGIANPVNIELFIGDDTGKAIVKLKGELKK